MGIRALKGYQLRKRDASGVGSPLPLADTNALQSAGAAFHALADTMPQIVWSTLPDGSHDYYNRRWYDFTGVPEGSTDGEGWAELFHPDDQPNAWSNWNHSLETGEPYEVEYRLRHHSGDYRWMIGRALPIFDQEGRIQRWIGTCTDIQEQKAVALQNELLSHELSHRIKNIFAIISGLVSLTARAHGQFSDVATELLGRLSALSRAHDLVRPHSACSAGEMGDITLAALCERIFASYPAHGEGRIVVEGPGIEVASKAATPVALVLHELATNAMKYGALSTPEGRLEVKIHDKGETVDIVWRETGIGDVGEERSEAGFGTRLVDMAVRQQLGGDYTRDWNADGLTITMHIRKDRIQAD